MDLGISGALYHVVLASMSRLKIGSNATDALIENIRVEMLKYQMPSFKNVRRNQLSNEGMRLANLRNYMFMLLRLTADRSLKLTIMPQENLNNIILFPAFYPQYKFPYCTSKILNSHLKEVLICFQI